ncbi:hypothetical protein DPEC_G00142560 [Dallia pectoralis]|uniref:Uncharacterized protein n=1 Tax=Dallia pectoralis TaxID=75939 RepID=A0ACC2GNM8_DALPE|nr:hypothetical protein DPEC_G00142560 [Dallia pectoralis]
MSNNCMSFGRMLFKGDFLTSNDGRSKAIFQDDGNFVVYQDFKVRWASNTVNKDALQIIMQADGNLVMYTNQVPIWSTKTNGGNANVYPFLRLTNEVAARHGYISAATVSE